MKTAVIILNWNGKALMQRFLPDVLENTDTPDTKVYVADNGSTDDSVAWLKASHPELPLLCLDRNYGFAEAYNKAVAAIEADYVVLLNSDVAVTKGWCSELTNYLDAHPDIAACQPKIRSTEQRDCFEHAGAAGGFLDRMGYPFCRGRIQDVVEKDEGQYDGIVDVFWATGACLCIRREDYLTAGGLDARFFAHMEEIDLCWRLRSRGRRIVCLPQSLVYHLGGGTLQKENARKTYLNFRNNLLMLYKNLPQKVLFKVLLGRFFLDYTAAVFFLLKGNFKSAFAVFRARRAYHRMRPSYKELRREIQAQAVQTTIPEIYQGCTVLDFHLKGKKHWSQYAGRELHQR